MKPNIAILVIQLSQIVQVVEETTTIIKRMQQKTVYALLIALH